MILYSPHGQHHFDGCQPFLGSSAACIEIASGTQDRTLSLMLHDNKSYGGGFFGVDRMPRRRCIMCVIVFLRSSVARRGRLPPAAIGTTAARIDMEIDRGWQDILVAC